LHGRRNLVSTIARLSLAQYDQMIEHGVFDRGDKRRLEFIRGEIRKMAPIGSLHEEVVARLTEWSTQVVPRERVRFRVQCSIGLSELESAPEPDLAWVVRRDYSGARPTEADVLLVIEVAESSLAYDCGEKADLYAAAGIADYWVVNLPDRCIEVRRDPEKGRYRSLVTCRERDEVRPLAEPEVALLPASLWEKVEG
jgi:Uma2 family endonuclease